MVDTPLARADALAAFADGGFTGNITPQKFRNLLMSDWNVPVNVQTANYTLVLSDAGSAVEMNSASATTVTIPPNSSVLLPLGQMLFIRQAGAGAVTVAAGAGVTLDSRSGFGLSTTAQWETLMLHQRAANEWVVQFGMPNVVSLTALVQSLPTTLPGSSGQLWLNGGVLALS